jgi:mannose-6-phosphate isomerase-like protein (cupin superfamily)
MDAIVTSNGAYIAGPIAVRPMGLMEKCGRYEGHAHDYDHWTFCAKGMIEVEWTDSGESRIVNEGDGFLTKAGVVHRIKDLVGGSVWLCTYMHRDQDGGIVEVYGGNEEAYR